MEYTVPEDGIHNEFDNTLDSASVNFTKSRYNRYPSNQRYKNAYRPSQRTQNSTLRSGRRLSDDNDGLFSLAFNPQLINTRRFVSTVDAAGLINFPLNLESIEYNLRNSLIKKNSDYYRRNNKSSGNEEKSSHVLFVQYLGYLFNFKVFFNPLLFFINLSFFFNIAGRFSYFHF